MADSPITRKFPADSMARDFDIFEELPDGTIVWRARVLGIENVELKVGEMAGDRKERFFAISLKNRKAVLEAFMLHGDRDKFVS
jgi:hypothetical protein